MMTKVVASSWVEVVAVLGFWALLTLIQPVLEWIKEKRLAGIKGMCREQPTDDSDQGENTHEQTETLL